MQNFDAFHEECTFGSDIGNLSKNLEFNTKLAIPPFPNVSLFGFFLFSNYCWFILQPAENLGRFTKDEHGREIKIKFDHGTTTLGFIYQGGVVLAVDSRATGGEFIGSQTVKKIVEISDFLLGK